MLIGGESIKAILYYNSCTSFDNFETNGSPTIQDNDHECPNGSSDTCIKLRGRGGINDMVDIILPNTTGYYDILLQFDARGDGVNRFFTYYKVGINSDWITILDSNAEQTFAQTFYLNLDADNKNNQLFIRFENTDTGLLDESYIDEVYIYGKVITPSPTNEPSQIPTISPTEYPTINPSITPTNIPSSNPSPNRSDSTTISPSWGPTIVPTLSPSSVITNNGNTASLPFNLSMETFLIIVTGTFICLLCVIVLLVFLLCRCLVIYICSLMYSPVKYDMIGTNIN